MVWFHWNTLNRLNHKSVLPLTRSSRSSSSSSQATTRQNLSPRRSSSWRWSVSCVDGSDLVSQSNPWCLILFYLYHAAPDLAQGPDPPNEPPVDPNPQDGDDDLFLSVATFINHMKNLPSHRTERRSIYVTHTDNTLSPQWSLNFVCSHWTKQLHLKGAQLCPVYLQPDGQAEPRVVWRYTLWCWHPCVSQCHLLTWTCACWLFIIIWMLFWCVVIELQTHQTSWKVWKLRFLL